MAPETCETPVPDGSEVAPDDIIDDCVNDRVIGRVIDDNADVMSGETVREKEVGGRDGPEPTRYGDWEKNGRCIDF